MYAIRSYYGYGGDFEPDTIRTDGNFCCNGLVASDRKLHPHAYEVQKVYQNIAVAGSTQNAGEYIVKNKYYFSNLNEFNLTCVLLRNGKPVITKIFDNILAEPQSSVSSYNFV